MNREYPEYRHSLTKSIKEVWTLPKRNDLVVLTQGLSHDPVFVIKFLPFVWDTIMTIITEGMEAGYYGHYDLDFNSAFHISGNLGFYGLCTNTLYKMKDISKIRSLSQHRAPKQICFQRNQWSISCGGHISKRIDIGDMQLIWNEYMQTREEPSRIQLPATRLL